MASVREIRNEQRARLHRLAAVEALYVFGDDDPVPVTVRIHQKPKNLGPDGAGLALSAELVTCIVFLRSELTGAPKTKAYVSVAEDEAYVLGVVDPAYGITREAEATRLSDARVTDLNLPFPGGG